MDIIRILAICIIFLIIILSIFMFIRGGKVYISIKRQRNLIFSSELFFVLFIVYVVVMIGFGLIYFLLSLDHIILLEHGRWREASIVGMIIHSIYFSALTLFTIGYGDIIPLGVGRLVAVIEGLIGYVLPTAFILQFVLSKDKDTEK